MSFRTRAKIEQEAQPRHVGAGVVFGLKDAKDRLFLEVLLDIRELLQNPPLEISGKETPSLE